MSATVAPKGQPTVPYEPRRLKDKLVYTFDAGIAIPKHSLPMVTNVVSIRSSKTVPQVSATVALLLLC